MARLEPFEIRDDIDDAPTKYDWSQKENVLFEVESGEVVWASVIGPVAVEAFGMASYCADEGGCLDYMIGEILTEKLSDGHYVAVNCEGSYYVGDGWTTDDDMELWFESVRPATDEEAREA